MRTLSVAALLATLVASSCGGDGGSCAEGTPCGGEIVPARYKITSFCSSITGTVTSPSCPAGVTVVSTSLNFTGTITFNADKTYASQGSASGTIVETIPASCLSMGGLTVSCAQLSQAIQRNSPGSSCSGSSSCTCTLNLNGQATMGSGTYATSGTTLTLTTAGGSPTSSQYCATPTSVTIMSSSMSNTMGMSGMMTMTMGSSTMVLTKE